MSLDTKKIDAFIINPSYNNLLGFLHFWFGHHLFSVPYRKKNGTKRRDKKKKPCLMIKHNKSCFGCPFLEDHAGRYTFIQGCYITNAFIELANDASAQRRQLTFDRVYVLNYAFPRYAKKNMAIILLKVIELKGIVDTW